jgi:hypothetical protein
VSANGPAALLALALALAAAMPVRAQEFLDRGTFVIERAGNEVGREDFAIRRTAGGGPGAILAVATVHYRDRDLRPALELTGDLAPLSYQVDISAGGRVVERFGAQFARGRIAARLATQQREVLREFPAPAAVAVLDDDAFDQFYFLPRAAGGGTRSLRILLPREPALVEASVSREGPDTVTVAGHILPADRFALRLEDGEVRRFWVTTGGDLLRVAIPRRELVATRTALPPR